MYAYFSIHIATKYNLIFKYQIVRNHVYWCRSFACVTESRKRDKETGWDRMAKVIVKCKMHWGMKCKIKMIQCTIWKQRHRLKSIICKLCLQLTYIHIYIVYVHGSNIFVTRFSLCLLSQHRFAFTRLLLVCVYRYPSYSFLRNLIPTTRQLRMFRR